MRLGDIEFDILTDGGLRLDGGAMFGVVPKPLWQKKSAPDERNRIRLNMNCLLIRAAGKTLLVETGAGEKWDAKVRDIYAIEGPPRLPDQLAQRGVSPEQIDFVINTHLHFDHCGWNTRLVNDRVVPTFPNAAYVVQRGELNHAKNPTERDRASYMEPNFLPIEQAGQWLLVDGEHQVLPGVRLSRAPGHNADMQCVILESGGKTAVFLADLVPTTAHMPAAWIMGYDLYPMITLENKKKWLGEIARKGWLALFCHDPMIQAAYLRERNGVYEAEPVSVD